MNQTPPGGETPPNTPRNIVPLAVAFEGGTVLAALVLGWLLGRPVLADVDWNAIDALWGLAATVPMLALFAVMVRWPVGPLGRIKLFLDEFVKPAFGGCSLADLAVISLLAGVGEELLFRGLLQSVLSDWLGLWPGVAAAAVLFGLAHLITPTYAVLATLIGLFFGWLVLATDNLLPAIVAHACYDFVALAYIMRPGRDAE